ncbi:MAG: SMC-Scp complex subunit ScpB [Rubripirellula sp.]
MDEERNEGVDKPNDRDERSMDDSVEKDPSSPDAAAGASDTGTSDTGEPVSDESDRGDALSHDDSDGLSSEFDPTDEHTSAEPAGEEDDLDGLSLDDLGAAYARVAAEHDPEAFATPEADEETSDSDDPEEASGEEPEEAGLETVDDVVTPEAIVEAALFVGHPENKSMSEQRLASLMRDVSPEEIVDLVGQLNDSYREADQALRIIRDDHGYRMTVAPEVESVRRSFLGKVRETRLSQMAIEVLSLVAYQPGVTAQKVQDQRGRESASLLNQLVRRQLLRIDRIKPEDGGRAIPHYYPTERFLVLFGLETLEDLPHVEEGLRED